MFQWCICDTSLVTRQYVVPLQGCRVSRRQSAHVAQSHGANWTSLPACSARGPISGEGPWRASENGSPSTNEAPVRCDVTLERPRKQEGCEPDRRRSGGERGRAVSREELTCRRRKVLEGSVRLCLTRWVSAGCRWPWRWFCFPVSARRCGKESAKVGC